MRGGVTSCKSVLQMATVPILLRIAIALSLCRRPTTRAVPQRRKFRETPPTLDVTHFGRDCGKCLEGCNFGCHLISVAATAVSPRHMQRCSAMEYKTCLVIGACARHAWAVAWAGPRAVGPSGHWPTSSAARSGCVAAVWLALLRPGAQRQALAAARAHATHTGFLPRLRLGARRASLRQALRRA